MKSRNEQILIGVSIVLIGILFIFRDSIFLDFGSVSLIILGLAFSLLYRTKKGIWTLFVGAFLIFIGCSGIILSYLPIKYISNILIVSLFLIISGACLLVLFFSKNKIGLLIPGTVLIALGVNNFIVTLIPQFSGYSFNLVQAIGFYYIYKKGEFIYGKWPLYTSIIFLILFISRIITYSLL